MFAGKFQIHRSNHSLIRIIKRLTCIAYIHLHLHIWVLNTAQMNEVLIEQVWTAPKNPCISIHLPLSKRCPRDFRKNAKIQAGSGILFGKNYAILHSKWNFWKNESPNKMWIILPNMFHSFPNGSLVFCDPLPGSRAALLWRQCPRPLGYGHKCPERPWGQHGTTKGPWWWWLGRFPNLRSLHVILRILKYIP